MRVACVSYLIRKECLIHQPADVKPLLNNKCCLGAWSRSVPPTLWFIFFNCCWTYEVTLKILKEWIEDEGGSWFINGMPWILVGDQPFPSPKNGSDDAQYAHKYYLNFRANFVRLWSLRISGQTLILQDAILLLVMWSLMCRKTASHASHFRFFFSKFSETPNTEGCMPQQSFFSLIAKP